jgi:hypothetical protein
LKQNSSQYLLHFGGGGGLFSFESCIFILVSLVVCHEPQIIASGWYCLARIADHYEPRRRIIASGWYCLARIVVRYEPRIIASPGLVLLGSECSLRDHGPFRAEIQLRTSFFVFTSHIMQYKKIINTNVVKHEDNIADLRATLERSEHWQTCKLLRPVSNYL